MARGINISIGVRGMARLRNVLNRLTRKARSRRDLHARWAVLALNWIDKNFKTEGGMVGGWKALSVNTLAARRGGSGRILQDKGILRASFVPRWTSEQASVGSSLDIAKYHEKGTGKYGPRGAPYLIEPLKPGGWLRFKMATTSGVKTKVLKSGKTIRLPFAKGEYVFAKRVMHPGVPARRLLPTKDDRILLRDLTKAALDYVRARGE